MKLESLVGFVKMWQVKISELVLQKVELSYKAFRRVEYDLYNSLPQETTKYHLAAYLMGTNSRFCSILCL